MRMLRWAALLLAALLGHDLPALAQTTCSITANDAASTTSTGDSSVTLVTGTPTAGSACVIGVGNPAAATLRAFVTGTWTAR